ncbi:putative nad dependent epimerase dehydratase family protein [Golovinomyces cichoracearum]|uniref:Putative nad dependent epimerase dehydratase family protein n=1 Tax=Golovinomyces cichoracearum TaxID=62708 RepID=A0A420IIJ1_9PEZI|nr:putative nad dependent epimerase dehydratase family protein [Golovinomyces cichoracearum]
MAEKPSVLIIGGLGFIGRFLALYIHENNVASDVRIVDKALPMLAWLAPEFKEACSPEKCMQADASKELSLPRVFDREDGKQWDFVFNCGGETRFSQDDDVYRVRSLALSIAVAKEAAKRGVKAFVELSTGAVYKSSPTPRKEEDKLKPWTRIAAFKLQAEEQIAKIDGLKLIIARIAFVYGDYATQFAASMLTQARVYKHLGEDLKWLWTKDLKVNTAHVKDVSRALWAMADWYAVQGRPRWNEEKMGPIPIFNIVDKGNTNQGKIVEILANIFQIKTGFQGTIASNFARMNIGSVVDDINQKVLGPWAKLLEDAGITRPVPITPFFEKELLNDEDLCMDGSRLEEVVGFTYEYPQITQELLQSTINSYIRMGWWPE